MTRSSLTVQFTPYNMVQLEKSFRRQYKEDHGEEFKGNFIDKITLGVIREKRVPDISDTFYIVKAGNFQTTDDQIYKIMERWMEDENNKARGYTGMFCDACKDLTLDIPLNQQFVQSIMGLEDNIVKQQESISKIGELMSKLTDSMNKIKDAVEENKETPEANETAVEG
jgi:uncharacterized coiled-coil protein SlyX